jgi:hypothetical protein
LFTHACARGGRRPRRMDDARTFALPSRQSAYWLELGERRERGRRSGRADGGSGDLLDVVDVLTACDRAHRTVGKRPGWLSCVCHAGSEVLNCP